MDSPRSNRVFSVLVGDDEIAIQECVVEVVAERGFQVFTASSGADALSTLERERVDFSILDVEMPVMTGIEVLQRYLDGPWIAGAMGPASRVGPRRMPTIFMSGNPAREIRLTCERLGSSFLDKPFAAGDMRAAVDRILADFLL
jgi:CheY-like chemotaxis protein